MEGLSRLVTSYQLGWSYCNIGFFYLIIKDWKYFFKKKLIKGRNCIHIFKNMLLSTSSKHTITTFPLSPSTVLQTYSSPDPTKHSSWCIKLSAVLENLPVLSNYPLSNWTQLLEPWPVQLLDSSQFLHLIRIYCSYKISNRNIMDSVVTIVNNTVTKQKIYKFVKHLLCASHYKC